MDDLIPDELRALMVMLGQQAVGATEREYGPCSPLEAEKIARAVQAATYGLVKAAPQMIAEMSVNPEMQALWGTSVKARMVSERDEPSTGGRN